MDSGLRDVRGSRPPSPSARMLGAAIALALSLGTLASDTQAPSAFASQIGALSEPGGHFDTDNLISNERSYLQVLPALAEGGRLGGAYLGVGPDQNFSYIAAVKPDVAFIIDIRRDNLLLHLLFKALFDQAASRIEYLALLVGRPLPAAVAGWREAPIDRIVSYLDRTAATGDSVTAARRRVDAVISGMGVELSREDVGTIDRFHRRFIEQGLDLRFSSIGRPSQGHYPTYRELLLETDAAGRQASYLASEPAFQFLKSLQAQDLVIPVVGDLSGPSALQAIGRTLAARRQVLSVFYVSNVEFYLYAQGRVDRFITNLERIPRAPHAVIVRSVFDRMRIHARPADASTSIVQPVHALLRGFADGRYRSYRQLAAESPP